MADYTALHRLAYSPTEAAAVLGMSRSKFYELLNDGTIPSCKIGALRRVRVVDLEAVLARAVSGAKA